MTDGKPSVLMLDLVETSEKAIHNVPGLSTTSGTLGAPYRIDPGRLGVVDQTAVKMPFYQESDIVVMDLRSLETRSGDKVIWPASGAHAVFTSGSHGFIDSRPYTMSIAQTHFDRILNFGGLFVVFAQPLQRREYIRANVLESGSLYETARELHSNYSFLSGLLTYLNIGADEGTDMRIASRHSPLAKLLAKHLSGGHFSCTFGDTSDWKRWSPLAANKYGDCVAALSTFGTSGGMVILLPASLKNEASFLAELFSEVLPEISPKLFPLVQRGIWTSTAPYEMNTVIELQERIKQARENAAKEIEELELEIVAERASASFLFDILRETGAPLVSAVKLALAELGFEKVVDVDEVMRAEEHDPDLREDLQIVDRSPLLTVDIKGLTNFPSDSDALQAHKHASIRMQELERLDIRALALINHQRNLPPLERDNDKPFRDELLKVAAQVKMGMMTTWDLHRLVRNAKKWGWAAADVIPVLYRTGKIEPIPEHYSMIGTVEHFYEEPRVASIKLSSGAIRVGDRIAFDLPIEFFEQQVTSLQVNRRSVDHAKAGSQCGVVTSLHRGDVKIGTQVFLCCTRRT